MRINAFKVDFIQFTDDRKNKLLYSETGCYITSPDINIILFM